MLIKRIFPPTTLQTTNEAKTEAQENSVFQPRGGSHMTLLTFLLLFKIRKYAATCVSMCDNQAVSHEIVHTYN